MTATLLGLAWAGVVLAGGWRYRPVPPRVPVPAVSDAPATPPGPSRRWAPVEALGTALIMALARRRRSPAPAPAPDPAEAHRVGLVALAAALVAVALPPLAPAVVLGGWAWPRMQVRRQQHRRLARLEAGLPEIVDLLLLAVGAGANVSQAVAAAGRRGTGPLAAELERVTEEVRRGRRVADAFDELPARAGEATRPLAAALAACERYGAPLGPALERLGDDVRRQRQRRAEEAARKVPVVLLFPLVLCILPAFALLTVAPLVAGALRALRL